MKIWHQLQGWSVRLPCGELMHVAFISGTGCKLCEFWLIHLSVLSGCPFADGKRKFRHFCLFSDALLCAASRQQSSKTYGLLADLNAGMFSVVSVELLGKLCPLQCSLAFIQEESPEHLA